MISTRVKEKAPLDAHRGMISPPSRRASKKFIKTADARRGYSLRAGSYCPGSHDAHTTAPICELRPAWQSRQTKCPVFGAYVFRSQGVQLAAPETFEAEPAGQGRQLPVGSLEYSPGPQGKCVGAEVGLPEGPGVGALVGRRDGAVDGRGVGAKTGLDVGLPGRGVGPGVGVRDGSGVGAGRGSAVGVEVGGSDGAGAGASVGDGMGDWVGDSVGPDDGTGVGGRVGTDAGTVDGAGEGGDVGD